MSDLKNARRRPVRCLFSIAIAAYLFAASAHGSIVVQMDVEELVMESDTIVQGTVEAVYSRWDAERQLVFTYTSVRVDDPLKGERRRSLLIRHLGGRIGSLRVTVAGMPEFEPAEDVIVFLKDSGNGTFQVVGMNQGRYAIDGNFAVSNVSGVDLLNLKSGLVSGASFVTRVGVEGFKQRIRELAE